MQKDTGSRLPEAVLAENISLREEVSLLEEKATLALRIAEEQKRLIDSYEKRERLFEEQQQLTTAAQQQLEAARRCIESLTHEVAQLKRLIFGTKSERFEPAVDEDQLPLFDQGPPPVSPEPVLRRSSLSISIPRVKKKPRRQVLPDHLPRETIIIEPDVDISRLKKIGDEVTETLDYRPARLVVIRRERPKYVDPTNEDRGVIIGSLPLRPICVPRETCRAAHAHGLIVATLWELRSSSGSLASGEP